MPTSQIVIPARLASTRLPRKLLLRETGKSLLQHTYESAAQARLPRGVIVATDHADIADEVARFGGQARLTSVDCASGTDRVAEIARGMPEVDIFVNVQGDEPELAADTIDRVVSMLVNDPAAAMATVATPIRDRAALKDPACVKVVFDTQGRALYFSRSAIPFARDQQMQSFDSTPAIYHQHLGLYAYRRDFLLALSTLPQTPLEQLESLEQLRVLESGYTLLVGVVDEPSIGIDTPDDYRAFVERRKAG